MRDLVRTLRADYAVNEFLDARITLLIWRTGQALFRRPGVVPFLLRRICRAADFVWTRGYIGADLPFQVVPGPGLELPHGGRGVVLHSSVRMGSGVTLYHQVTLGVVDDNPPPTLGDDVYVGAGAKILGPVHLGNGCRVGANAVVITDVPDGATAVGVPASIRRRRVPEG